MPKNRYKPKNNPKGGTPKISRNKGTSRANASARRGDIHTPDPVVPPVVTGRPRGTPRNLHFNVVEREEGEISQDEEEEETESVELAIVSAQAGANVAGGLASGGAGSDATESKHDGETRGVYSGGATYITSNKIDIMKDAATATANNGLLASANDKREAAGEDSKTGAQRHQEFNTGSSGVALTGQPYELVRADPDRQYVELDPKTENGNSVGDKFNFEGTNKSSTTLRAQYLLPGSEDLVPTEKDQLEADVEFDLFSVINPGFGLGQANKLHVENEARQEKIRFAGPLFTPSADIGPEMGAHPVRPELRRVQPTSIQRQGYDRLIRRRDAISAYLRSLPGGASSMVLPDDNNQLRSSKGLKRRFPSPLLPIVDTHHYWSPVKEQPGISLNNNRKFRRFYDPLRIPRNRTPYEPLGGGPTLQPAFGPMTTIVNPT